MTKKTGRLYRACGMPRKDQGNKHPDYPKLCGMCGNAQKQLDEIDQLATIDRHTDVALMAIGQKDLDPDLARELLRYFVIVRSVRMAARVAKSSRRQPQRKDPIDEQCEAKDRERREPCRFRWINPEDTRAAVDEIKLSGPDLRPLGGVDGDRRPLESVAKSAKSVGSGQLG